jgi:CelD/BcsL family acetyltransferase involved in cellulose biosynthesis
MPASPATLRIECVDSATGLEALASAWDALSTHSPTAMMFNSHAWVSACWRHFHAARAARSETRLCVLCAWQDGSLVAVAPFRIDRRPIAGTTLATVRWIGEGPSDYGDLLLAAVDRVLVDALIAHLFECVARADLVDLRECRGDSPAAPLLRAALERHAAGCQDADDSRCRLLPTEEGWTRYQETRFSGKRRKDLRREWRKLETVGDVELSLLTAFDTPLQLAEIAQRLGAIQAAHPAAGTDRPGEFNDPVFGSFLRDWLAIAAARGWMRLALMSHGGVPVAYWLAFRYRDRHLLYNTAHRGDAQHYAAGKLLMLFLLEALFREGEGTIDFLRGAEAYKDVFTDLGQVNRRLSARARTLRGQVGQLLAKLHAPATAGGDRRSTLVRMRAALRRLARSHGRHGERGVR